MSATGAVVWDGGVVRLFSHSVRKSEACFLRLLGVKRLSIGGSSSSSLPGLPADATSERRDADAFLLLRRGERRTCQLGLDCMQSGRWKVCVKGQEGGMMGVPYSDVSFSSPFSGMVETISPFTTVEPLHRSVDCATGLSQLDQSSSSSTVKGVHE